jgi:hypothetical protein
VRELGREGGTYRSVFARISAGKDGPTLSALYLDLLTAMPAMPHVNSTPVFRAPPPLSASDDFKATFFKPHAVPPARHSGDTSDTPRPRCSYSEDLHGSHAAFQEGPDFPRYRDEVRQQLDFLADFCRRHGTPDAQLIAGRLQQFYDHRFVQAYFDTHEALVDSRGKQALDSFCDQVRDDRIPLSSRTAAIRNLSEGVLECASGAVSNLIAADGELSMSQCGIRSALWKMKESMVAGVLRESVSQVFGSESNYAGNEIHFVNSAWNYMADTFGLQPIPDWMAPSLHFDALDDCRSEVRAALKPARLAGALAEQCMQAVHAGAAACSMPPSGDCTAGALAALSDILEQALTDLQLPKDALALSAFVRLGDDGDPDNAPRYSLRTDCTLVARNLLKAMSAEGLLEGTPVKWGEWRDAQGQRCAWITYGNELTWMARRPFDMPLGSEWDDAADVELVTVADLRAWSDAQGAAQPDFPVAAFRRVVRSADAAALAGMPAGLLREPDTLFAVLDKLDDGARQKYLQTHLPYFLSDFPIRHRAAVVERLRGWDGIAVSALVRAWSPGQ